MLKKIFNFPIKIFVKSNILKKEKLSERFNEIYRKNYWGDFQSVSGPGSSLKNSKNIRIALKKIIKEYKISSITDAPCGDCNWIKNIFNNNKIKYLGVDIVAELIEKNKIKYNSKKNFNFKFLDLTKNKIPSADLIICRDLLFHLSFKDGKKFLRNLFQSKYKYLLMTSHSNGIDNNFNNVKDIESGDFRKINIFKKPYNLNKNYELLIKDFCDGKEKYMILFKSK